MAGGILNFVFLNKIKQSLGEILSLIMGKKVLEIDMQYYIKVLSKLFSTFFFFESKRISSVFFTLMSCLADEITTNGANCFAINKNITSILCATNRIK